MLSILISDRGSRPDPPLSALATARKASPSGAPFLKPEGLARRKTARGMAAGGVCVGVCVWRV